MDLILRVTQDHRNNPLDVFEHFMVAPEQAILLQALLCCLESEQFVSKAESALNYQQIQKAVQADDVLRDIVAFFLNRNFT